MADGGVAKADYGDIAAEYDRYLTGHLSIQAGNRDLHHILIDEQKSYGRPAIVLRHKAEADGNQSRL